MPAPLNLARLPEWTPASKPRVFFPSRWDESKGGQDLLNLAAEVTAAVGKDAEVVGIDWGDRAVEAAELGVTLLPRMSRQRYVAELARAHVAVAQTRGILAVSELQAMAIGVPLIFPDPVDGYPTGGEMGAIVAPRADAAEAVIEALQDPPAVSARAGGTAYVRRHHDPATMVARLKAVYAGVLADDPDAASPDGAAN